MEQDERERALECCEHLVSLVETLRRLTPIAMQKVRDLHMSGSDGGSEDFWLRCIGTQARTIGSWIDECERARKALGK